MRSLDLYYLHFLDDRLGTKCLVYGIVVWEWVQTALVTNTGFAIDVYNFGSISSLTSYHSAWFSIVIMSAVVSAVVQSYFAWRIWVLGQSKILTGVIVFVRTDHYLPASNVTHSLKTYC